MLLKESYRGTEIVLLSVPAISCDAGPQWGHSLSWICERNPSI